ncbi:hypothetical protein INT43_008409 [Umbelopsis isabellina]|uniref:Zn(2)-C6 fungal-type domain-containing protein n=1 Tax=Mortierella isabellina TaxID=91625 RepID=A0A8H7UF92_MORIS|nr:hypothetical protein INT43_008409 [Umbelopsis isabellina]
MPPRNESSAVHSCDLCKRKKLTCNGERPCANCFNRNECRYTAERYRPTLLASSNPQSRRLSSGSACETCRRRKTKCDGQQPCNYCSTNGIECLNNSERRKRGLPPVSVIPMKSSASHKREIATTGNQETTGSTFDQHNIGNRDVKMLDAHVNFKNEHARKRALGSPAMDSRASSLSDSTSEFSTFTRQNRSDVDVAHSTTSIKQEPVEKSKAFARCISQSPPSLSPINLASPTSSPPFATSPLPAQSNSGETAYHPVSQISRYHIPPMYNSAPPPSIRARGQRIANMNIQSQEYVDIPTPPTTASPVDIDPMYKRKIPSVMGNYIICLIPSAYLVAVPYNLL